MIKATIAATALSSASNILAQILETYQDQKPLVFDVVKFIRFILVTLIDAPANYKWQQFLESRFPGHERSPQQPLHMFDVEKQRHSSIGRDGEDDQKPKLNMRNTIIKTLMDCTLGAIFNTVAFFVIMGVLKQQSIDLIWDNIRHETIGVIVAGFKIWPLASFISFSCVHVEHRIVFLSFIALIWGIYMSLVATRL